MCMCACVFVCDRERNYRNFVYAIMGVKMSQDLQSSSWRPRTVNGVFQFQSKGLRTRKVNGISFHLKPTSSRLMFLFDLKGRNSLMLQIKAIRSKSFLLLEEWWEFLFYSSLQLIEWGTSTLRRATFIP